MRRLVAHGVVTVAFVSLAMGLVGFASLASNASTGGYGNNQLNLLAWFNSRGTSAFLPALPLQAPDQGEGYQYLGLGVLLVCLVAVAGVLLARRGPGVRVRPWAPLVAVAAFWFAFAVSHHIAMGSRLLVEVPLPQFVLDAAGTFRASGRMALLATYVLVLAAIAALAAWFPRASVPMLAVACVLQWMDIAPLRKKFDEFGALAEGGNPADCGPLARARMPVTVLPEVRVYGSDTDTFWDLAICAGRHSLPINSAYLGRYDIARYMANSSAVDHSMMEEPPRADRYYAYRNEAIPRAMGLPKDFGSVSYTHLTLPTKRIV